MQPLIDQLINKQGLTTIQATGILSTIKAFIDDNFPAFGNSLDTVLANTLAEPGNYSEIRSDGNNTYPLNAV